VLSFSGSLKIWVGLEPCDMRKGYEGLTALVTQRFGLEATSGALFVFTNRNRTRLKILYWDGTGLWLLSKRLEKGRFSWPEATDGGQTKLALRPEAFAMLTDGVQLRGARLLPWYEKSEA
jgi:transposase